jgi:hypothetical protein
VDLTNTPNSTSSNAWPARPHQARTRYIPSPTILRAFLRVLSGVGVRADRIAHCPATHRAAGFLIETDSISGFSRTLGDSGRQPAGQSSFSRGISVVPDRLRGVFIKSAGEPISVIGPT